MQFLNAQFTKVLPVSKISGLSAEAER